MVGVLAGRSLVKGLSACGIGLVIGSIGGAPATGEFRMVMGIDYLYDGIPLVIVGLGLFAVPEIVDLLRRDRPIAADMRLGSGWFAGVRDWWRNWFPLGALLGSRRRDRRQFPGSAGPWSTGSPTGMRCRAPRRSHASVRVTYAG